MLKKNIKLVGHGSQYERNFIKKYLEPFKEVKKLYRQSLPTTAFDNDRAKQLYKLKKEIAHDKTLSETEDQIFLNQVLPILIEISNLKKPAHSQIIRRIFPKETHEEIPPIPNFQHEPQIFAKYIGLLTHTKFHYKN